MRTALDAMDRCEPHHARVAEVEKLYGGRTCSRFGMGDNEKVLGFQIAMSEASGMEMIKGSASLG